MLRDAAATVWQRFKYSLRPRLPLLCTANVEHYYTHNRAKRISNMVRTYSILGTHDELNHSPLIQGIQHTFDIVLTIGTPTVVNFLLQFPISIYALDAIHATYEDESLKLGDLFVERYANQTLLSTTMTVKEIGTTYFTLSVPLTLDKESGTKTYTAKKVPTK